MTLFDVICIVVIIGILSGLALGGFVLVYERRLARQRSNYREGLHLACRTAWWANGGER